MEKRVQEHEKCSAADEVVPVGEEEIEIRHGLIGDDAEGSAPKDRDQGTEELDACGRHGEGQQASITSAAGDEQCPARQQQERREYQDQMHDEWKRKADRSRRQHQ